MKVALINEYKDHWKAFLKSTDFLENAFYFEIIDTWRENWNGESTDIATVYNNSLQSKVSARLWGGNVNSPKSMMMVLFEKDPEFMKATFRDLFNEKLDLGLRLDRFGFHADQILRPLQGKNPKIVSHFHHDREILCLYLALEYPENYCLFDYKSFEMMMAIFESRNTPSKVEVERYYKSCRGIKNLISKDEELINEVKRLTGKEDPQMMLMSLFMEFVSKS